MPVGHESIYQIFNYVTELTVTNNITIQQQHIMQIICNVKRNVLYKMKNKVFKSNTFVPSVQNNSGLH